MGKNNFNSSKPWERRILANMPSFEDFIENENSVEEIELNYYVSHKLDQILNSDFASKSEKSFCRDWQIKHKQGVNFSKKQLEYVRKLYERTIVKGYKKQIWYLIQDKKLSLSQLLELPYNTNNNSYNIALELAKNWALKELDWIE